MAGRRKRYYHKTIVLRGFFSNTLYYAAAVLFALGILIGIVGKMDIRVGNGYILSEFRQFLRIEQQPMPMWPTIYDSIFSVIPSVKSNEEMAKKYAAMHRGVQRETENESNRVNQLNTKSIDMSAQGITFRNETAYTPDVFALLNTALSLKNGGEKPHVLILHTHTSEAYAESEGARSTDNEKNVVRVGTVLKERLEKQGISVTHDVTRNDYPAYNGSYTKALSGISAAIEKNPSISVVFDVHRDYAEQTKDGKTVQLKPVADVSGEPVAQIMFVVGTDGLGLYHPNWKQNLAFAVQIQEELNKISTKIARPINIRRERFNQHMTQGSLIIEVGTAGNSLDECERAAEYLGDAVAKVLKR